MAIQCTIPGWRDVWGMIAGATTNVRTAIGTVTEAQMPRIFGREYCAEFFAAAICAGSDCVVVMPIRLGCGAGSAHRPAGSRSARLVRREGDTGVPLPGDAH
jgi:hypothetical protein